MLLLGDCLVEMHAIPDKSVDLVLVDPPYGKTGCKWDVVIPLGLMWQQLNRVAKERAAMVFMAGQPFTSVLINSNLANFKYTWAWDKVSPTGHLHAKQRPLAQFEDICVFYRKPGVYNPQGTSPTNKLKKRRSETCGGSNGRVWGKHDQNTVQKTKNYPRSIIQFSRIRRPDHPTEKPVALIEYLIRTYSNPGDVVLDFAMGSGTTGAACAATQREFIGIEKDPYWFGRASDRIMSDVQLSLLEA